MSAKIRNLTLGKKLLALPVITLIGLAGLQGTNSYLTRQVEHQVLFPNFERAMENDVETMLRALVDAEAVALGRRTQGLSNREEQIAALVAETDPIRFFEDRSGYFFTYDLTGTRVNVPTNKRDNGKNLIGLQDPNGVPFIRLLAEKARSGGGFVSYVFEKPGKGIQPKVAYVAMVPGTDFFVGTGVYIDNIEAARAQLAGTIAGERSRYEGWIVALFLAILACAVAFTGMISRAVTVSIQKTVKALLDGSHEISEASAQLSSQSQMLAQGASEQVAKIDITAESLRDMAGMSAENSENAQRAEEAARMAQQAADRGSEDARQMREAITAISASSSDIVKVIKAIDEIAFQTNILALNAAVEAARAGEAGMAFAVVADEVRSLAQKSAHAARESTEKIESAVARTTSGVRISLDVAAALEQVVGQVHEIVERIGHVASASVRQSKSVEEMNAAVGAVNQVSQTAAASAEESAAAAEELNAQAECMRHSVSELLCLVGGEARLPRT